MKRNGSMGWNLMLTAIGLAAILMLVAAGLLAGAGRNAISRFELRTQSRNSERAA